ncbi:hypothetical protein [Streptomyces virginiae]|nr:hypothetical protein [Streptomyces virginiae]
MDWSALGARAARSAPGSSGGHSPGGPAAGSRAAPSAASADVLTEAS